jgi:gluconate 5-dehydrogenase
MNSSEPTIQQLFDLTGKVALITGGTGFLGAALAAALAEAGATVVISSRDEKRAKAAADQLVGGGHHGIELDHKDEDSIKRGFAVAVKRAGQVDILINNGQSGAGEDWTTLDAAKFNDHLANATGYFLLARELHKHAVARQIPASIVMLGSMYGLVGSYPDAYEGICPASSAGYHALKGGVVHLTRHLAVYWAKDGVRVNCLSPGPFPAPKAPQEMVERLCGKSPMRRMGLPHELKGAVVFLASDASSYMTGQNLVIDGGWTAW